MKLLSQYKIINKKILDIKDKEILSLKAKIFVLERKVKDIFPLPIIKVDEEDPDSLHLVDRKSFVARVAGFHFDILSKKIKRMIADTREAMMTLNRETFGYSNSEFDLYLKGMENGLWMLYEWGESAVNEKIGEDKGDNELTESEKSELKDKINK